MMDDHELVLSLIGAAGRITRRLDGSLSSIKGISFNEYQLLSNIKAQPAMSASRVDLAELVGLTPSGVTRALKPLEKLGFVETVKDGRDARRSLASLTAAGIELVDDAAGVVSDVLIKLTARSTLDESDRARIATLFHELAHA